MQRTISELRTIWRKLLILWRLAFIETGHMKQPGVIWMIHMRCLLSGVRLIQIWWLAGQAW